MVAKSDDVLEFSRSQTIQPVLLLRVGRESKYLRHRHTNEEPVGLQTLKTLSEHWHCTVRSSAYNTGYSRSPSKNASTAGSRYDLRNLLTPQASTRAFRRESSKWLSWVGTFFSWPRSKGALWILCARRVGFSGLPVSERLNGRPVNGSRESYFRQLTAQT